MEKIHSEAVAITQVKGVEKTYVKALGLGAFAIASEPSAVDVKDGKIIRIRPLHYEWKYRKDEIKPWRIERNDQVFEPILKSAPSPYMLAYKRRT